MRSGRSKARRRIRMRFATAGPLKRNPGERSLVGAVPELDAATRSVTARLGLGARRSSIACRPDLHSERRRTVDRVFASAVLGSPCLREYRCEQGSLPRSQKDSNSSHSRCLFPIPENAILSIGLSSRESVIFAHSFREANPLRFIVIFLLCGRGLTEDGAGTVDA